MEKGNLGYPPHLHHCFHKHCLSCLQQYDSAGIFIVSYHGSLCGFSLLSGVEDIISAFNEDSYIFKMLYHNLS